jgi:hypothetical protein
MLRLLRERMARDMNDGLVRFILVVILFCVVIITGCVMAVAYDITHGDLPCTTHGQVTTCQLK